MSDPTTATIIMGTRITSAWKPPEGLPRPAAAARADRPMRTRTPLTAMTKVQALCRRMKPRLTKPMDHDRMDVRREDDAADGVGGSFVALFEVSTITLSTVLQTRRVLQAASCPTRASLSGRRVGELPGSREVVVLHIIGDHEKVGLLSVSYLFVRVLTGFASCLY
jgi:hypothetical protein